jgi:hypothetical protein
MGELWKENWYSFCDYSNIMSFGAEKWVVRLLYFFRYLIQDFCRVGFNDGCGCFFPLLMDCYLCIGVMGGIEFIFPWLSELVGLGMLYLVVIVEMVYWLPSLEVAFVDWFAVCYAGFTSHMVDYYLYNLLQCK